MTRSPVSAFNTLDSNVKNERFGFSTGALEKGNYRVAIDWLRQHEVRSVELSALRFNELQPLVDDLDKLPIDAFGYVSFHAPSSFHPEQESRVLSLLEPVFKRGWNIVVHPDVIYTPSLWKHFGQQLLIENMDRRKTTGRTVQELGKLFEQLPSARMCLDVAHARQLDTTLTLLGSIVKAFKDRIAEVHISELDSRCRHRPLSGRAIADYHQFAASLRNIPVIIESMLEQDHCGLRQEEVCLAHQAMDEYSTRSDDSTGELPGRERIRSSPSSEFYFQL